MKIKVIAHIKSKQPRVEKDSNGIIHVYIASPPVGGNANREIIGLLGEYIGVGVSRIKLLSGETSKHKFFELP